GRVYQRRGDFANARVNYAHAIEIAKKFNDDLKLATGLSNLASLYVAEKEYEKGIQLHREVLKIKRKIGDKRDIAVSVNSLGWALLEDEQVDSALVYFQMSNSITTEVSDIPELCISHIGLGSTLLKMQRNNEAMIHVLKAEELSRGFTMHLQRRTIHELLAQLYEKKGNFKKAYDHHTLFKTYADSLFNEENTRKITQLEYKYKYADSMSTAAYTEDLLTNEVRKADLKTAESKQETLWWIIGFLIVLITSLLIITVLNIRNTRSKIRNVVVEQKLLRTQMTPHFMFNAMGIIQGMILEGAHEKSLNYLSNFSKLLRLTLENSKEETVSLKKELEAINSYVVLQNSSTQFQYNFEINMDPDIEPDDIEVPPMLIQPFIENALEHGFKKEVEDKRISINLQFDDGDLVCVILDNGIGIDHVEPNQNSKKNSMSTEITRKRLSILARQFNSRMDFSVKDRSVFGEQGTMVALVVPYVKT
ncbi:MAG: tetratricopeptide repeat protein, partial [Crocinitomicaceae bacterium]